MARSLVSLPKISLCFSLLMLASCAEPPSEQNLQIQEYVIKGDPDLLVAGSQMKSESPLNANNISELKNYNFYALASFQQKAKPKKILTKEQLLEENAASEKREARNFPLKLEQVSRQVFKVSVEALPFSFVFKEEPGETFQIKELAVENEILPVQILHWSQTPDKSMINFLVSYESPKEGKGIAVFYFQKKAAKKEIPLYDKIYRYLAGPGVGVRWSPTKSVTVHQCGTENSDLVRKSVNMWSTALKDRLQVNFKQAAKYPPFSDLNHQGIYHVNVYNNSPGTSNFGVDLAILDLHSGFIVDSDVLIFNSAFDYTKEKLKKEMADDESRVNKRIEQYRIITYGHELGHFFGLDHQFDGTHSIMSYNFDSMALTNYDLKAIQTLYPKTK